MSDPKPKDKVEEERKPRPQKPPGWRNFQKVLKQVVKAPPLRRQRESGGPRDPVKGARASRSSASH